MINLHVNKRTTFGKTYCKKIKKMGYIPSIIHIKNENIFIEIEEKKLNILNNKNLNKEEMYLILDFKKISVKIINIQYHVFKNKIIHIDFIKI